MINDIINILSNNKIFIEFFNNFIESYKNNYSLQL